jgi:hypothetical protein
MSRVIAFMVACDGVVLSVKDNCIPSTAVCHSRCECAVQGRIQMCPLPLEVHKQCEVDALLGTCLDNPHRDEEKRIACRSSLNAEANIVLLDTSEVGIRSCPIHSDIVTGTCCLRRIGHSKMLHASTDVFARTVCKSCIMKAIKIITMKGQGLNLSRQHVAGTCCPPTQCNSSSGVLRERLLRVLHAAWASFKMLK